MIWQHESSKTPHHADCQCSCSTEPASPPGGDSRSVFFGGFAAGSPAARSRRRRRAPAAGGLGDLCQRGADNPHEFKFWRIR